MIESKGCLHGSHKFIEEGCINELPNNCIRHLRFIILNELNKEKQAEKSFNGIQDKS